MNILYIHGFGSRFDPLSEKVVELSKLGKVEGIDIDWTENSADNVVRIGTAVRATEADLLVGTSMGGWGAAAAGAILGIPFVAINPSINPRETLSRYVGAGSNYDGVPYYLSEETVRKYFPIPKSGCGLILLDEGDEVLPYEETVEALRMHYDINTFEGGSHRFEHMEQALPIIENFYNRATVSYGHDI